MPLALAGSVPLPAPSRLSAVLALESPATFFDEFAGFAAYFYPLKLEQWPPLFRMYQLASMLDISVETMDLAGFFDDEEDHTGAYAHETEAFLREIGAPRAAALLADAIRLFANGEVPEKHAARVRLTERLRDRQPEPFEAIARKHKGAVKTLYGPLQKYMRAHAHELQAAVDAIATGKPRRKGRTLDAALATGIPAGRRGTGVTKDHFALLAVWERINERMVAPGFDGLTRGERLVHVLWFVMDSEIENGGLHQFLSNASGDFAEEAKRQLKEIGARDTLAVLGKASAVFPRRVVPSDRRQRNRILEQDEAQRADAAREEWTALDREYRSSARAELHAALLEWIRDHPKEFPDPDDAATAGRTRRKRRTGRSR